MKTLMDKANIFHISYLAGILSLILTFLDGIADLLYGGAHSNTALVINIILSVLGVLATTIFDYSFVVIGKWYNKKLVIYTWLLICLGVLSTISGNLYLYNKTVHSGLLLTLLFAVLTGVFLILFGIELKKLVPQIGKFAKPAGIIDIVAGAMFVSVIFAPIGAILVYVADVYLIMILYRLSKGNSIQII